MSDSTKLDLDALEALEKAATRGNWVVRERKFSYSIPTEHPIPALEIRTEWVHPQLKDQDHVVVPCTRSAVEEWAQHGIWVSAKDAALIVALRNAAPALIAAARRVAILERQDREAATYVESVICMRTHFTGEPPNGLDGAKWDVLWCLFRNGATWDGNIPSKSGRDRLISQALAYRDNGWTILTIDGFHAAVAAGMDKKKGTR